MAERHLRKLFNILNHQRNANQNKSKIPSYICKNGHDQFLILPILPGLPAGPILPAYCLSLPIPPSLHPEPSPFLPPFPLRGAGAKSQGQPSGGSSFVSIACLQQARYALCLWATQPAQRSDLGTKRDITGAPGQPSLGSAITGKVQQ